MKSLDGTFLIDYLDGVEATSDYLEAHNDEAYVLPVPAYGSARRREERSRRERHRRRSRGFLVGEIHAVDKRTAGTAAEIAAEIGPQEPFLSGMDALTAAVGREFDAPVVLADRDLTHPETQAVVDVKEYR